LIVEIRLVQEHFSVKIVEKILAIFIEIVALIQNVI
ncbi:unnamed protein product, partial [marine sediment metagenome]